MRDSRTDLLFKIAITALALSLPFGMLAVVWLPFAYVMLICWAAAWATAIFSLWTSD